MIDAGLVDVSADSPFTVGTGRVDYLLADPPLARLPLPLASGRRTRAIITQSSPTSRGETGVRAPWTTAEETCSRSRPASALRASSRATRRVRAQAGPAPRSRTIDTSALTIGFEESGDPQGFPVVLLHGFPDDVRAFDGVAPPLANLGYRVIVPYLRGFGPTRIRDPLVRTGEQAAIGQDVIDLMDAIGVKRFAVAGYDWGGRAGALRLPFIATGCARRCSSAAT